MSNDFQPRIRAVRMMIFDVDGVFTDGTLYYGPDGESLKAFNVLDGLGIQLLAQAGIETAVISARQTPMVERRFSELGITHCYFGIQDKLAAFTALLEKTGFQPEHCGYMGDDLIDLPVLLRVAFGVSVPNGHAQVRTRAAYVTRAKGGQGAVREVCDLLLQSQEKFAGIVDSYLK